MTNLTEQYRILEQDFFAYQKMLNEANKDLNRYYLENTELKETISNDIFLIKSRDSEIVKLKELLKECREILLVEEMVAGNPRYIDELRILIKRINQVLGEE